MNVVKIVAILVLLFTPIVEAFGQRSDGTAVRDEILVKFKSSAARESSRALHDKSGAAVLERFADLGWQRIRLPKGMSVQAALEHYNKSNEVESAQPNYYYQLLATPNDANFSSLYGMTKISAPLAWDLNTGSPAVVVANIDTGVKYTHEDLAANMWTNSGETANNGIDDDGNGFVDDYYGYDFFYNDSDPMDENGHGTHTSGTIGAVGNNSIGVAGVAWNVRIMSIKIFSAGGSDTTSAMLINAYNYVRMMKNRGVNIRITNNSYGGCNEACGYDQATKDAIDALGNTGVLQVFAAGNNSRNTDIDPAFPASYTSPTILSVANSNSADARSLNSNFGAVSVDLAAPGSSILSTIMGPALYGSLSGTSMSAPHVSGAAALLVSQNPNLSAASLKATIINTVDRLSQFNGVVKSGGRLNAANALQNQTLCSFNLSNTSVAAPTKGGYFSVSAAAAQNCDYAVKSNSNWISVLSPDAMSGNGSVSFRVSVNPTVSRTGTITIAGQVVTVTQSRGGNF